MSSTSGQPQFRYTQTPSKVLDLRNLPWECIEEELVELCKPFGKIVNTKCNVGANRNQAFVEFVSIPNLLGCCGFCHLILVGFCEIFRFIYSLFVETIKQCCNFRFIGTLIHDNLLIMDYSCPKQVQFRDYFFFMALAFTFEEYTHVEIHCTFIAY